MSLFHSQTVCCGNAITTLCTTGHRWQEVRERTEDAPFLISGSTEPTARTESSRADDFCEYGTLPCIAGCQFESFQESGALIWIPRSRALIQRTPTKRTPNSSVISLGL